MKFLILIAFTASILFAAQNSCCSGQFFDTLYFEQLPATIFQEPKRKGKKIKAPIKTVGGKSVPKYMQESCFLSDIDPLSGERDPEAWGTTDHEYICCVKITRWQEDPYNVPSPENECSAE
jgi:hypothetical protein